MTRPFPSFLKINMLKKYLQNQLLIQLNLKKNLSRTIFEECGFNINIIGVKRVEQSAYRWKKIYEVDGLLGLQDTRKNYSGRPKNRDLTDLEKIEKLEAKIKLLEVQNEFLKKLKKMRRGW